MRKTLLIALIAVALLALLAIGAAGVAGRGARGFFDPYSLEGRSQREWLIRS